MWHTCVRSNHRERRSCLQCSVSTRLRRLGFSPGIRLCLDADLKDAASAANLRQAAPVSPGDGGAGSLGDMPEELDDIEGEQRALLGAPGVQGRQTRRRGYVHVAVRYGHPSPIGLGTAAQCGRDLRGAEGANDCKMWACFQITFPSEMFCFRRPVWKHARCSPTAAQSPSSLEGTRRAALPPVLLSRRVVGLGALGGAEMRTRRRLQDSNNRERRSCLQHSGSTSRLLTHSSPPYRL